MHKVLEIIVYFILVNKLCYDFFFFNMHYIILVFYQSFRYDSLFHKCFTAFNILLLVCY